MSLWTLTGVAAFCALAPGWLWGSTVDLTREAVVSQSSDFDAAHPAANAIDGSSTTLSFTQSVPDSYWQARFRRRFPLTRIELVNQGGRTDHKQMDGLVLRVFDIADQTVFSATVTNPGPAATWAVNLPPGLRCRSVRVGLENGQKNGGGTYTVALAEMRIYGDPTIPYLPIDQQVTARQSSDYSAAYLASNALDGNAATFTHTADLPNSYWFATFPTARALTRIELVNRADAAPERMAGLTLRILDAASNAVASTTVSNPGAGGIWVYTPPAGTVGRFVRVGLEGGAQNGDGNYYVSLAEARFYGPDTGGTNYALGGEAFMVRLLDSLAPPGNGNDGQLGTEVRTTTATVDGYWEVDLKTTRAIYGVRTAVPSGFENRMTNTTVRLFDTNHESVCAQRLGPAGSSFDTDVSGPVCARYVRVGLENKARTAADGGTEWYIGLREVQVFGRPTTEVGILDFRASTNRIARGESVTLTWQVEDVAGLWLYPGPGPVGRYTAAGGAGALTLTPTQTVACLLVASNACGLTHRAVTVVVADVPPRLQLSEAVAVNRLSLRDGHNESPDWIELYNPGAEAVNLLGYGLSDDPARPLLALLPAVIVPAHGYAVVCASGRDAEVDERGFAHVSFRLSSEGETLVLTAPDGVTTLDTLLVAGAQGEDLAYGRTPAGTPTFIEPTPGGPNLGATYAGWLQPLAFSHARGYYTAPFTLVISNANAGAAVMYGYGGGAPATPYAGGLSVNGTRTVRAAVSRAGYRAPRTQTQTYVFLNDVVTSSVLNPAITQDARYAPRLRQGLASLPAISIAVASDVGYAEQGGSMEVLWPDGRSGVQADCGVMRFGSSYQYFAKLSFRLSFRREYGTPKLEAPLFDDFAHGFRPESSFDELDLRSGQQDMSARGFYMAGPFVEDTMLDMGSLNPHGRFVHVYLNGVYHGQYQLHERLVAHFLADYLGGPPEAYVTVRGNDNYSTNFVLGTPDPLGRASWETMRAARSRYRDVRTRLDVPNLADFMLTWFYGNAEGEYRSAGPFEPGSGFKFWLADADGFLRTSALNLDTTGNPGPAGIYGALAAERDPDFKMLVADRIQRHCFNGGALTPERLTARLNARMNEVRDSLIAECARWGYRTPENWEAAAQTIRDSLFPVRTAQLVALLRGRGLFPTLAAPTLNQHGGLVTAGFKPVLTAPAGTLYFTTDGSDPRLPGGAVAPGARVWSAGIVTVNADLVLLARARKTDGSWSALIEASFLLAGRRPAAVDNLLVTELHYNPAGSDETAFIEFYNPGTNLVDLTGVRLSDGVTFAFPAGFGLEPGRLALVVEDPAAFAARYRDPASPWYAADLRVAGAWSGSLAKGGERVAVVASNGSDIAAFAYAAGGDWPERADGCGSSLELRTPAAAPAQQPDRNAWLADGRRWRSSPAYHGSPGRLDPYTNAIVISEVLAHTDATIDWVELHNRGTAPVDITGWRLSDRYDLPLRFTLPSRTVVSSGGRITLDARELGFGFSELGSAILLTETTGTNIVRFVDTADFPATAREETLGRFTRSDGEDDFTELRAGTPGGTNALPRIGPVVIAEILYRPATGQAEFVELVNVSASPVSLYDPLRPTNTWSLGGAVDYAFPTGLSVPAGGVVVVCATNPAAFRLQAGVPAEVPVLGPWKGALDAAGETLKLYRPGDPEPDGTVPRYRADRVSYRPLAPWPVAAAAGGVSLERVPPGAYGNDPAYWRAAAGGGTPGRLPGNPPPAVHVTGLTVCDEEQPIELTLQGVDGDAPWQQATVEALSLPAGCSFDPVNGRATWTPGEADGPAEHVLRFLVRDNGVPPGCVTQAVVVSVREVNRPPRLAPAAGWRYPAGLPLATQVAAGDPDLPTQRLTFAAAGLPDGVELDGTSGRFSGAATAPGVWTVQVSVADDQSPALTDSNRLTLVFSEAFAAALGGAGADGIRVTVPTLTGETYVVESADNLLDPSWRRVEGVERILSNRWMVIDAAARTNAGPRFYRVRWLRVE